jgi:CBS domain-containing protein
MAAGSVGATITGMEAAGPSAGVVVEEAMHRGVVTCRPETSATAVLRMMAAHRIHSVLVVAGDGSCSGIVRDTELENALGEGGLASFAARDLAVEPVVVDPSDSVEHAVRLMHDHATTHLVVAESAKCPVGVLSILDVADVLSEGGAS